MAGAIVAWFILLPIVGAAVLAHEARKRAQERRAFLQMGEFLAQEQQRPRAGSAPGGSLVVAAAFIVFSVLLTLSVLGELR